MGEPPVTRYADSNGVSIAYQVLGGGPIDVVFVFGWVSNIDLYWSHPAFTDFQTRLARVARVIVFDKRGTGLSDPVSGLVPFDVRMDDIRAVMDAAGSSSAIIFGYSEGVPLSILFAASHPERTQKLILCGGFASGAAFSDEFAAPIYDAVDSWGQGNLIDIFAPSRAADPAARAWTAAFERSSASPGMVRLLVDAIREVDVRPVLQSVRVPTLVLHRSGEYIPLANGREVAEGITGSRFVEVPGTDHTPWGEGVDVLLPEVLEFITGSPSAVEPDRVLATVLVTDLVGSTAKAAQVGDKRWKEILAMHDLNVRRQLLRYRGYEVNTTGDGFIATFDGPTRAVRCALDLVDSFGSAGTPIRAGLHSGEIELADRETRGIALHIAARIAAEAGPNEVLVSGTVKDLVVGSGLSFAELGTYNLKGVPGEWRLFGATT